MLEGKIFRKQANLNVILIKNVQQNIYVPTFEKKCQKFLAKLFVFVIQNVFKL